MNENKNNNFSFPASAPAPHGISYLAIAGALLVTLAILGAIAFYIYYGMTHTPSMDTPSTDDATEMTAEEPDLIGADPVPEFSLKEKYRILEELVASSTSTPMTVDEQYARLAALEQEVPAQIDTVQIVETAASVQEDESLGEAQQNTPVDTITSEDEAANEVPASTEANTTEPEAMPAADL